MVFEMRYRAIPMAPTYPYGIVKSNIVCTQSKIFHEFVSGLVFFLFVRKGQLYLIYTPGHLTLNPKKHAVEQKNILTWGIDSSTTFFFFVVSDCTKSGRANQKWLKSFLGPRGRSEANMKKLQLDVGNLCPGWCWCPLFQPQRCSNRDFPVKTLPQN